MKTCVNCWGYQEYDQKYLSPEKFKEELKRRKKYKEQTSSE